MSQYLVGLNHPDNDPSIQRNTIVKTSEDRLRSPIKTSERTIWIMASVLAISVGFLIPNAAAQPDPYPRMAPVEQYLMEENAEIELARSAAPDSISRDATILVLGRHGYETAVKGKNGFVCLVARG